MIGFSYIYKTQTDIFGSINHLSEMSFWDILAVLSAVWIITFLTFIIVPSALIFIRHKREVKAKHNKKKLLTQILLQKEIEDEVEKEIQIEQEKG